MRDEMDARMWVEHHDAFARQIGDLFEAARVGLAALNRFNFQAPWHDRPVSRRGTTLL